MTLQTLQMNFQLFLEHKKSIIELSCDRLQNHERVCTMAARSRKTPGDCSRSFSLRHLLSTGNIFSRARKCRCLIGLVWFNERAFLSQWEGGYFERRYKRRSARGSHTTRRRWAQRNGRPLLSYSASLSHFTSTCCKRRAEKLTHKTHRCSHGQMSFAYSAASSSFGPLKERKQRFGHATMINHAVLPCFYPYTEHRRLCDGRQVLNK